MGERLNYLKLIQHKKEERFTGALKLVFQGRINSVIELNAVTNEIPLTVSSDYAIVLEKADKPFYGTIILQFESGNVIAYAYSKRITNSDYADL